MCGECLKTARIQHDRIMALEVTRAVQNACVKRVQQNEILHQVTTIKVWKHQLDLLLAIFNNILTKTCSKLS